MKILKDILSLKIEEVDFIENDSDGNSSLFLFRAFQFCCNNNNNKISPMVVNYVIDNIEYMDQMNVVQRETVAESIDLVIRTVAA